MLWEQRLRHLLRTPFTPLTLPTGAPGQTDGRYLSIDGHPFALGRMLAQGAEAIVYELVDLREPNLAGVVKVCRYRPGTREYRSWAVPFRFEYNRHSSRPDVELRPARLVEVPGGLVKVQEYVPLDWDTDWSTELPGQPVRVAYRDGGPEEALQRARELIELHGEHGILLELQGSILWSTNELDAARAALERAVELYASESRPGVLRAGITLAAVHRSLYEEWLPDSAGSRATLELPGGLFLSQAIFAVPEEAAADDMLDDRSLYTLYEILGIEPYCIPALLMLVEELGSSPASRGLIAEVLDMIDRADPGRDDVDGLRERYDPAFGHSPVQPEDLISDRTAGADPGDPAPTPAMPEDAESFFDRYERTYQPEPDRGQLVEARLVSALANLHQGRLPEAERAALDALALAPDSADPYLMLSRVLVSRRELRRAMEVLHEAVRRVPHDADVHTALGELLLEQDLPEEARTSFLRALLLEPAEPWRVELGLGVAYRRQAMREIALEHLRAAYEMARYEPGVALHLANALRESAADPTVDELREAMQVIDQSLEMHPDTFELLFCRAQIHAAELRLEAAISDLQRAVALNPDDEAAKGFLNALLRATG